MKKSIIQLFVILNCLILCGCITPYEAMGVDEQADILVVDGIITDDESIITLSRSVNLTDAANYTNIDDANVYIECDDGTQWQAEPYFDSSSRNGLYTIKTGQLNPDRQYRLKIEIEEFDNNSALKTYEYRSDFSYPIKTPEIDSVFWMKKGKGQPIIINVATHSPDNQALYYYWSYREDWEINSEVMSTMYPYYCWNSYSSRDILLGSAEKTVLGKVTDFITEIHPSSRKLSVLYRIVVRQNAISKQAYDYFENVSKNAGNIGSIFASTPSELKGNITCITDPDRPVIGYVEISFTTQKTMYIPQSDDVYERIPPDCMTIDDQVLIICLDCRYHGTEQKPDDWPNDH